MKLKQNQLLTSDGSAIITICGCDDDLANILISLSDEYLRHQKFGQAAQSVSLPSLKFQSRRMSNEMMDDVFAKYLSDNGEKILSMIEYLNSPNWHTLSYAEHRVHLTAFGVSAENHSRQMSLFADAPAKHGGR